MLKWIIKNRLAAFEKKYDYDMSHAREMLAADTGAFMAFMKLGGITNYRKAVDKETYWAAKLVGNLSEDCGPCTQLNVAMALEAGVDPKQISAVVSNDREAMSDNVRLGVDFARASLARDPEADTYREEVSKRWGQKAVISLAFALAAARVYPTLKYALGHGKTCQRVTVAGTPVAVVRDAA